MPSNAQVLRNLAAAAELGRTLDFFKVPKREKTEVLGAFTAHKGGVTRRVRREP